MTFDIDIDADDLRRALRETPDGIMRHSERALTESINAFDSEFQRTRLNFPKASPPKPRGGGLRRVTGRLSTSFKAVVQGRRLADLRARYFTDVKYARPHELGTKTMPKRMGLFKLWVRHVDSDLMPRVVDGIDRALREAGR